MGHSFQLYRFKTVDSTNVEAKKGYATGTYKTGAVIVAESQWQGRGQLQTKWHDSPGNNLMFTLVFEPYRLLAKHFFRLNQAVSLAITDILPRQLDPQVKWPNDVFLNKRKTAGVLIETQMAADCIKTAFIGIGLNVNQVIFPSSFTATSLKIESGHETHLPSLLDDLLQALDFRLKQMQLPALLDSTYKNRLLGTESYAAFEDANGMFNAKVIKVEEDGRLVLSVPNEPAYRYYRFKEVKLVG